MYYLVVRIAIVIKSMKLTDVILNVLCVVGVGPLDRDAWAG